MATKIQLVASLSACMSSCGSIRVTNPSVHWILVEMHSSLTRGVPYIPEHYDKRDKLTSQLDVFVGTRAI